jgi:hypothetical protein
VSRQAATFEIVDSATDPHSWDIKISEPAQCSVGLFVNWVHIKDQILQDGDLIGLGLAGVLAYESNYLSFPSALLQDLFIIFFNPDTATKKLLPYGASVDAVKGARSEFIYKFTKGIIFFSWGEK